MRNKKALFGCQGGFAEPQVPSKKWSIGTIQTVVPHHAPCVPLSLHEGSRERRGICRGGGILLNSLSDPRYLPPTPPSAHSMLSSALLYLHIIASWSETFSFTVCF